MQPRLASRGSLQVDLYHLGRTRADEEQELDVGAAFEKPRDDSVELVVDVGDAGQIPLVENCGGETRLGENHHAGRGLNEMGASARAHNQKERILDLAMEPDDSGEAAEHLTLPTFLQHRRRCAAVDSGGGLSCERGESVHGAPSQLPMGAPMGPADAPSRAARSFSTNCAA